MQKNISCLKLKVMISLFSGCSKLYYFFKTSKIRDVLALITLKLILIWNMSISMYSNNYKDHPEF